MRREGGYQAHMRAFIRALEEEGKQAKMLLAYNREKVRHYRACIIGAVRMQKTRTERLRTARRDLTRAEKGCEK